MKLVNEYTMDAGVRSLERHIASLMRKTICVLQEKGKKSYRINEERVYEMLGAGKAVHRFNTAADHLAVGTVNGMAWTSVGGTLPRPCTANPEA
jgi:ATP-dependent Lon protease